MTAIILSGGRAKRMAGFDKAFLKIKNEPLIRRQVRLLRRCFDKVIIVTNSPQKYKGLRSVRLITDIVSHQGPLGAILSGLEASPDQYNFVIACDMPFINTRLIKYMYKNISGYDAVVPKINNRYEPLFSVYSKSCLCYIKKMISKKSLKISGLFPSIKLRVVTKNEISQFAPPEKIFANINNARDLIRLNG